MMFGLFLLVGGAVYLAFCVWFAWQLAKGMRSVALRGIAIAGAFCVFAVIPVIDGIFGNITLNKLCKAESKTEILGKVAVPREVLAKDLKPRSLDQYGNLDWKLIGPYLELRSTDSTFRTGFADIERITNTLVRVSDGAELAVKRQEVVS